MATFVIGDVHGCLNELNCLIKKLDLKQADKVWFIGDLVGRGPKEQAVVERILSMGNTEIILGNHDLHFLAQRFSSKPSISVSEKQRDLYLLWLQRAKFILWHGCTDTFCVHAGFWHAWTKQEIFAYAKEVGDMMQNEPERKILFDNMYSNKAITWTESLENPYRYQTLINIFTRIRAINTHGDLNLSFKGRLQDLPRGYKPWYSTEKEMPCKRIIFGHWASLQGISGNTQIINIDGGLIHGGRLLAVCLDTGQKYMQEKLLP